MSKCNDCKVYWDINISPKVCTECDDNDSNFIPRDKEAYDFKCKLLIIKNKLSDIGKTIDEAEHFIDNYLNNKS